MELPSWDNPLKGNFLQVSIGRVTVWFSFRTPVAFQVIGQDKVIRENEWGPTTGKHLNYLCSDKSKRVNRETFKKLWDAVFTSMEKVGI